MTDRLDRFDLAVSGELANSPAVPAQRACEDRSFEFPPVLHYGVGGLFLAFIAMMAIGFSHAELVVPLAVITFFIIAFFAVPTLWVKMNPDNKSRSLTWDRFRVQGVVTETGRCSAGAAVTQMMVLPVLILLWGVAVVTIAALV
jgi:hypothetical protein